MEYHVALFWDQCFSSYTPVTTPLAITTRYYQIISSFDINHHLYVNGTQIYMSLSVSNAEEYLEKLQHCLMGVSAWMTGYKIKLNPSKTKFPDPEKAIFKELSAPPLQLWLDASSRFLGHIRQHFHLLSVAQLRQ